MTVFHGRIIKTDTGAIQFVRNPNTSSKSFLLVTGKHDDIYIPVDYIYEALEDEWVADSQESLRRKDAFR